MIEINRQMVVMKARVKKMVREHVRVRGRERESNREKEINR